MKLKLKIEQWGGEFSLEKYSTIFESNSEYLNFGLIRKVAAQYVEDALEFIEFPCGLTITIENMDENEKNENRSL